MKLLKEQTQGYSRFGGLGHLCTRQKTKESTKDVVDNSSEIVSKQGLARS